MNNKITNISIEKTARNGEVRLQIDFSDDYRCCKIIQLPCNPREMSLALADIVNMIAHIPEEMEQTLIPKLEITWTKCSERMPPDSPGNPIIVKLWNSELIKVSARWFLNVVANKTNIDVIEWTPYTPEAWAELNRK